MKNQSELEYLQVQRNQAYNNGDTAKAYELQEKINNFVPLYNLDHLYAGRRA